MAVKRKTSEIPTNQTEPSTPTQVRIRGSNMPQCELHAFSPVKSGRQTVIEVLTIDSTNVLIFL